MTYNLPAVSDNCEVAELTLTEGLASGETFPVGETEVSFEVIDIHGNESECTFVVTVTDAEGTNCSGVPRGHRGQQRRWRMRRGSDLRSS